MVGEHKHSDHCTFPSESVPDSGWKFSEILLHFCFPSDIYYITPLLDEFLLYWSHCPYLVQNFESRIYILLSYLPFYPIVYLVHGRHSVNICYVDGRVELKLERTRYRT